MRRLLAYLHLSARFLVEEALMLIICCVVPYLGFCPSDGLCGEVKMASFQDRREDDAWRGGGA